MYTLQRSRSIAGRSLMFLLWLSLKRQCHLVAYDMTSVISYEKVDRPTSRTKNLCSRMNSHHLSPSFEIDTPRKFGGRVSSQFKQKQTGNMFTGVLQSSHEIRSGGDSGRRNAKVGKQSVSCFLFLKLSQKMHRSQEQYTYVVATIAIIRLLTGSLSSSNDFSLLT